jgi:hypothetical protein
MCLLMIRHFAENELDGLGDRPNREGWSSRSLFAVVEIDKDGSASRRRPGFDIAGAIPDHVALGEIDPQFPGRIDQHARLRLAAVAVIARGVEACDDRINRHCPAQPRMHLLDDIPGDQTFADVRLVGNDDQHVTRSLEARERFGDAGEEAVIFQPARRKAAAIAEFRNDQHAVTIEKNRARHSHHFVFFTCRRG